MKNWLLTLLFACAWPGETAEPRHNLFRVRSGTGLDGKTHRFADPSQTKATVFVFLGPECPVSQRYIPELNRIAASATNGIDFFGVLAGKSMTRTQGIAFAKAYAIQFPVLFDDGLALARWLRPTHMPEAFVLKPDGDVVYRGRINDWYQSIGKPRVAAQHHELRDALTAIRAGKTPKKMFAPPVGCYFEDWPVESKP